MRNLLKRRPRDEAKPSLRERFAATKAKYARTLAVHRVLNAPPPEPAPDRLALVTYASWLYMERRVVCRELYPHLGHQATSFVASAEAAERFHYPSSDLGPAARETAWKASARAVPVLDLVGVDWRADLSTGVEGDGPEMQDTGERPAVPFGWPRIDAALLDALDDLNRLDAAQVAMGKGGLVDRDVDTVPGYDGLEEARDDALDRLAKARAESLIGLQAKAKALLTRSVSDLPNGAFADIAESLARDLLGLSHHAIEPRPDPILAAIEECRRLMQGDDAALTERRDALLQIVPTTAAGCMALARFAVEFFRDKGRSLEDVDGAVLALIARSPLL